MVDNDCMQSNDDIIEPVEGRGEAATDTGSAPVDEPTVEILPVERPRREMTAGCFRTTARVISDVAAGGALRVPAFRSPPRSADLDRSISHRPGGAVVAVRMRNRPIEAVQADLIEGVVVANRLDPLAAALFRRSAWSALSGAGEGGTSDEALPAGPVSAGSTGIPSGRHEGVAVGRGRVVDLVDRPTAA